MKQYLLVCLLIFWVGLLRIIDGDDDDDDADEIST